MRAGMFAPPNLGPDYQQAFRAVFDHLGERPGVFYDPFFLEGVATIPASIKRITCTPIRTACGGSLPTPATCGKIAGGG